MLIIEIYTQLSSATLKIIHGFELVIRNILSNFYVIKIIIFFDSI
jgi:hypothetical protein